MFRKIALGLCLCACFHLFGHRLFHRRACACACENVAVVAPQVVSYAAPAVVAAPACSSVAVAPQAVAVQSYAVPSVAVLATPFVASYGAVAVEPQVVVNAHSHVRVRKGLFGRTVVRVH